MIKFEINAQEKKIHFDREGTVPELVVDALTLLKRVHETILETDSEAAAHMVAFIISQLVDHNSGFYDEVEWDDDEWEEEK